jgi:phage terminase large subunit GpA-like protein
MNLRIRDESAFLSEYQNLPPLAAREEESFDGERMKASLSGRPTGWIPESAQFCTAMIDVHKNLLFWALCAWDESFNGTLVDYGTYPEQKRSMFTLQDAAPTLLSLSPGGLEAAIYDGIKELSSALFNRQLSREDGADIGLDRLLIDANWGPMTDVVYQVIADQVDHRGVILPSHGVYVGAASKPFSEYAFKRGDRAGLHWRIPNDPARKRVRKISIDTNFWKTFVFSRLKTAPGDPGRLAIDGTEHALLVEHLTAETCTSVEAKGKRVDEWKAKPGRDNHWLDCLVGCAVGASVNGAKLASANAGIRTTRTKVVSLAALQRGL